MDVLEALRLQVEWGADEALEEAPVDRLAARVVEPSASGPQSAVALATRPTASAPRA